MLTHYPNEQRSTDFKKSAENCSLDMEGDISVGVKVQAGYIVAYYRSLVNYRIGACGNGL